MSRAREHEVSSPISLFPFIGILLCTMGALLVILVAVSRSARTSAERQVQSGKQAAANAANDGTHKKLEEVQTYIGSLKAVRGKAEGKLRDEQVRLSNVEDHIRRLHERIAALQSAAIELEALEKEHYDDRQQAEREIARLQGLIGDAKKSVAALQEADGKESRSYAVVPYEGPNGTFRRPIYVECVKDGLILQPEGVHLTADDLRPPLGPGNPLASVLRASRDHLVRMNPKMGESRDLTPYPLLLVRSDGLLVYDRARQAIEAGDFDLGFELIEDDWKIKFPQPDPQLAAVELQALDQSRARQVLLAAAAPRAYRNSSSDASDDDGDGFGDGGGSGGSGSTGGFGGGEPGGGRGSAPHDYVVHNSRHDGDEEFGSGGDGGGSSGPGGASSSGGGGSGGPSTSTTSTGPGTGGSASSVPGSSAIASAGIDGGGLSQTGMYHESGDGTGGGSGQTGGGGGESGGTAVGGSNGGGGGGAPGGSFSGGSNSPSPAGGAPDKNLLPDGYQGPPSATVIGGSPSAADATASFDPRSEKERMRAAENRGKDWALKQKPARAIPVRRTIRVTVAKDQVAILPDSGPATAGGKAIPIRGDTVESLDEFVKQVRDHIDGWGMAGNGLYWRPVVVLNVAPDGQQRASDLTRLLKNSGLEIRADETAKNLTQGSAHETR